MTSLFPLRYFVLSFSIYKNKKSCRLRRLAQDMLGLQVDNLRFLARMRNAIEQNFQQLFPQSRLVHVKCRERRFALFGFRKIVKSRDENVPRDFLVQESERVDDCRCNGIVGADKAFRKRHVREGLFQFFRVAIGEGVLFDKGVIGIVFQTRQKNRLAHGKEALVERSAVRIVADKSEVSDSVLADERKTEIFNGGKALRHDDIVVAHDGEIDGEVKKDGGISERDKPRDIVGAEQFHADDAVHLVLVQIFDEAVEKGGLGRGELQQLDILCLVQRKFNAAHNVDEECHRHQVLGGDQHDAAMALFFLRGGNGRIAFISHLDRGGEHPFARARRHILPVERLGDGIAGKGKRIGDILYSDPFFF